MGRLCHLGEYEKVGTTIGSDVVKELIFYGIVLHFLLDFRGIAQIYNKNIKFLVA